MQTDRPGASGKRRTVYGPEPWQTIAGAEWSWWDLWFAVVAVAHHGGDWQALDAALCAPGGPGDQETREAKWSHLLDLTERLQQAGLTAADVAGELAADRATRAKARTKVMRSHLYPRDLTDPMRTPPSARLEQQALTGAWSSFPVSPQPAYDNLIARFELKYRYAEDGMLAQKFAYRVAEWHDKKITALSAVPARALALRRGGLAFYYDVTEHCDDSYGGVGEVVRDALEDYVRADWRSSGITPEAFWRDLLGWWTMAGNYGVAHRDEATFLRRAGVRHDLDTVETVLADLTAAFTAARMTWHRDQALVFRSRAVVAAGALDRFTATAQLIGSRSWIALDAMVTIALDRRRPELALAVLDAADVPGFHQQWIQKRRTELLATHPILAGRGIDGTT